MTICSAACQIARAVAAEGKKLLWLCLPPGQKNEQKRTESSPSDDGAEGWCWENTTAREERGPGWDGWCPLEQPRASPVPPPPAASGWVPPALPTGAGGARFWHWVFPPPNAKPGPGADTNTAVSLKRRCVFFTDQQDEETRPS